MRKLTKKDVTFTVSVEPEDLEIRGNYIASGDDAQDTADENECIERLNRGDVSAWCCLVVTAEWEGFEGKQYLGGCSFSEGLSGSAVQAEAEQMADCYDMRGEALAVLNDKLVAYQTRAAAIAAKLAE